MIRRPPRSTQSRSSAASDVYKRQCQDAHDHPVMLLTGVPGVGKRRLALHFAQSLPEGWASGWLAPRQGDRAVQVLRHCEQPTAVLVDEADTRADAQSPLIPASELRSPQRVSWG